MLIALTRPVSPTLAECELTHLSRAPIDVAKAEAQHAAYEALLASLGATVVSVVAAPAFPDAVFIEDTALVLDEVAVLTRPGVEVRRGESADVGTVLERYRSVVRMKWPATLDGGDVLHIGRTLYVGRSARSNAEGIEQLARLVHAYDYRVVPVALEGCLHLKSAVTAVADRVLLFNPAWVSASAFPGCDAMPVAPSEPYGANGLRIADSVVYGVQFPITRARLEGRGLRVAPVDCSELAKAEGAVTCCSLVFEDLRIPG